MPIAAVGAQGVQAEPAQLFLFGNTLTFSSNTLFNASRLASQPIFSPMRIFRSDTASRNVTLSADSIVIGDGNRLKVTIADSDILLILTAIQAMNQTTQALSNQTNFQPPPVQLTYGPNASIINVTFSCLYT